MSHYYSKYILAALFCALIPIISGCAEVKEINDMAIVSGISVDVTTGGGCLVSAELVNKASATEPEEAREIISASGSTLGDALENCNFKDSRQIYFSHAKTLVISKELASSGIEPILDYVMRNYKMRLSMDLLISDLPSASSVSALSAPSAALTYLGLEEMIKTDSLFGACAPMKVYQAVNTLSQTGTELTIPIVTSSQGKTSLSGTAVFRGGKLVGTLTAQETPYLLLLQDHMSKGHLTLPEKGLTFLVEKARTESSWIDSVKTGVSPHLKINIKLDCTLAQTPGPAGASDFAGRSAANIQSNLSFSAALERAVEASCQDLIKKVQGMDTDIFGFGKSMQGVNYNFSTLPFAVECEVRLKIGEVH